MDDDDKMIVVVVGDEDEVEFEGNSGTMCAPIPVKEEPLDENEVMEIMETAARFGQPIKFEIIEDDERDDLSFELAIQNIKKEINEMTEEKNECDSGDDNNIAGYNFDDEDYINSCGYEVLEELNEDEDYQVESADSCIESDTESGNKGNTVFRRQLLSPSKQKSFVEDLRQQYPELRKNQKALIKSLVEIMRNCKPPNPPKDYCVMNDIMYECVKCGAISSRLKAAARHYQEKHGPRYLVCFACGVDFRSKTNLYKHEKRCQAPDAVITLKARAMFLGRKARSRPYIPDLHTVPLLKPKSSKRFPCCECSATFTTKYTMLSHLNMHRGVRPYCCDQCPSAYTSASALTRHLKKHSDEQYICDHCSSSFKIKAALVAHMDTHQPIPKYACGACAKRYATKNALNHHVRRVHLRLPMPCACHVCPKRYPRMSLLRDHMKKKHGMSLMTRKMFFKALPTLTDEQLQQAKVILKHDEPLVNLSADISRWAAP